MRVAPTKLNHLLLALFLCLGMIGLSGAGIGRTCSPVPVKECGCCPMESGEVCCSADEEAIPAETPMVPASTNGAGQHGVNLGMLETRPVLMILPVETPVLFPPTEECSSMFGEVGVSAQALLCVRTV